jgi:hypothetical protein
MFKMRRRYHKRRAKHRYPETGGAHRADPLRDPWERGPTRYPDLIGFREAQERVGQTRWYVAGSETYNSEGQRMAYARPHGTMPGRSIPSRKA